MSTKIYNGFRMNTCTMTQLNEFYRELRELYHSRLLELCKNLFLETAKIDAIELIALGINPDQEKTNKTLDDFYIHAIPITRQRLLEEAPSAEDRRKRVLHSYLYELAEERIINRVKLVRLTQQRDPAFDFEGELSIITKPGIREDKTLLLAYGDRFESFMDSLVGNPPTVETKSFVEKYGLEAYPYWNNTDYPEDKTKEEWNAIGDDWNIALNNGCCANQNGFSMSLFDLTDLTSLLFRIGSGLKKFPDENTQDLKDFLARYIACEKHRDAFLDSIEEVNVSSVFKYADIKAKWKKTDDYKKAVQEELDNLAECEIPTLSELLFESVKDIIQLFSKEKELQNEEQRGM